MPNLDSTPSRPRRGVVALAVAVAFSLGWGIGAAEVAGRIRDRFLSSPGAGDVPGSTAATTAETTDGETTPTESDLLAAAFTDALIDAPLLRPPVDSWADVVAALEELVVPAQHMVSAGAAVEVVSERAGVDGTMETDFRLHGTDRTAYTYSLDGPPGASCAVLLIPGSGNNRSSEIRKGIDYHGDIAARIRSRCDLRILIKPNEDLRALHDGGRKLGADLPVRPPHQRRWVLFDDISD